MAGGKCDSMDEPKLIIQSRKIPTLRPHTLYVHICDNLERIKL